MNAFTSRNPATGAVLFTRPAWTRATFDEALQRTQRAQRTWAETSIDVRAEKIVRFAETLSAHRDALAALITQEVGRLTQECLAEIDKSVQLARYYAECAPRLLAEKPIATNAYRSVVRFEPLGTVLAVMPWNYPVWQILRFALPALIAGNACVVKPAPSVPQTTALLAELLRMSELSALVHITWLAHDDVEYAIAQTDAVAFTGSTATGRHIAALAGRHLKKSVLELGGSNPIIVLEDADLELAAREACHSRFRDAGQSCNAAKRMIVLPKIAEEFIALFLAETQKLHMGETLAPLARADLRENIHAQVLDAQQHGAQCVCGGYIPKGTGFFYPATVLDYVSAACRVYHEETFGPVASVIRAASLEEAVHIANDTPYGLGATVFTADTERAWHIGKQLNFGSVFINRYTSSDLRLPFGGVKASGYGRELSEFGLYEFLNVKTYWQR